ncbi:MAG: CehA/McbA family metallohydrolase [Desulfurococcaceae archaeon]
MSRKHTGLVVLLVTLLLSSATLLVNTQNSSTQGVVVVWGPTPIMEGEAVGPGDLTIMNEYYAVAFALTTDPPFGIPRGHIVDLAPAGEKQADVLAQFSFPLNDWANWATIDLEKGFTVIDESPSRVTVIAVGKWKGLQVNYTYIFEAGKPYFKVIVNVTNVDTVAYVNHIMGPAITFEVGWAYVPGEGTKRIVTSPRTQWNILDDWVAGYHEHFAVGLYAPNYTHISAATMWVDPFYQVTLQPGESRVFESWIIVLGTGNVCEIAEVVAQLRGQGVASVQGTVRTTEGKLVEKGILMVEIAGRPYCWSQVINGSFTMKLPAPGTYNFYAEARAHAPSSKYTNVTLAPEDTVTLELTDVKPPGYVNLRVTREDTKAYTDAVVLVSSSYVPTVMYIAVTSAYTDPFNIGHLSLPLAPGNYTLSVGWAPGFLSRWVNITLTLESGEIKEYNVTIPVLFKPWEQGWYMADLHHHSDYMDGRTPPEYLVVAQSAFGLDFIVVSDHDFVGNCPVIEIYATMRNKTFICSVEISPPWAHFNAYPILYPERLRFKGTMREIIEAARAAGALVIRANHPYIGGLFIAQELGSIPGGYYEDWDVAEINGPWGTDDNRTFTKMMTLWNMGIRKYLTAGSDVHDVWATPRSGFPRVVAYLPEGPSVVGLARAELTGRTFITYGPFVFTNPLPGTTIPIRDLSSNITISAKLFAVWNLSRVEVWSLGRLVRTISLSGESADVNIELPAHLLVNPNRGFGWVLLIVYDTRGNRAITNPIWIDLTVYTTEQPSTITETVTTTLTETLKETVVVKEVVERTTTLTVQSTVVETEYVTVKDVVTVVETLVEIETKHITATITETTEVQQPALTIGVGVVALLVGLLIGRAILTTKPK